MSQGKTAASLAKLPALASDPSARPSSYKCFPSPLTAQPVNLPIESLMPGAGLSVRVRKDQFCYKDFLKDRWIRNSQKPLPLQDRSPLFSANQF
ncbi:hypothetical protein NQZ68_017095 [Dissostichus eleginoides]|nr:hypothetical protein NQZ68_017095 [Dissostichus eleginoides]